MKYSRYLSVLLNGQEMAGIPSEQLKLLLNVVMIEGKIRGIQQAQRIAKSTENPHLVDLELFKAQAVLSDLTGNLSPEEFYARVLKSLPV